MKTVMMDFRDSDQLFKQITWGCILFYATVAFGVNLIKIEKPEREDFTQLSPRIAQLIVQATKPVPPPIIEVKKEEPKPEEKPTVEEKVDEGSKAEQPQEVAKRVGPTPEEIQAEREAQRKKNVEIAMNTGLLKLLKQTEKQPTTVSETRLNKTFSEIQGLSSTQSDASKPGLALQASGQPSGGIDELVSKLERTLKDSKVTIPDSSLAKSGGINAPQTQLTSEQALKERKTASVENPFKIKGFEDGKSPRSYETILEVVEGYKGGISFIYNKALRTNPTLRGTVTVEFTIAASGEVIDCKVMTSSMNDPSFEATLVKRVLQWRFPPIPAGDVTVVYPIVFFVTG